MAMLNSIYLYNLVDQGVWNLEKSCWFSVKSTSRPFQRRDNAFLASLPKSFGDLGSLRSVRFSSGLWCSEASIQWMKYDMQSPYSPQLVPYAHRKCLEDMNHSFFLFCPIASSLWSRFLYAFRFSWVQGMLAQTMVFQMFVGQNFN